MNMNTKEIKRLIKSITPEKIKEIVLDINSEQKNIHKDIHKGSVDILDLYLRLINKKELTAEYSKIYSILRPIILKNIEKIPEFKFIEGGCMPDEIYILK